MLITKILIFYGISNLKSRILILFFLYLFFIKMPLLIFCHLASKNSGPGLLPGSKEISYGGERDGKKVCWVSWDRICQPKEKGGLGITNLALFNSSLLCNGSRGAWMIKYPLYDLLKFRYEYLLYSL
jgi:hypothetical protein